MWLSIASRGLLQGLKLQVQYVKDLGFVLILTLYYLKLTLKHCFFCIVFFIYFQMYMY